MHHPTRRQALAWLGAAGALSVLGTGRRRAAAATCALSPAQTEGPYFVDELLNRSDVRVDPSDGSMSAGVPLRLRINVLRADAACAPAAGVRVDLWHADAGGRYSDEAANGTVGRKFLRGYQTTGASGAVAFTTVYPGWYSGRTIHIHVKLRATNFEFTTQLYFDDALSDRVLALAPYGSRGTRDRTNATDAIYANETALLLAPASDGNGGYTATFDARVDGLPATTGTGGGAAACADVSACRAALAVTLPDPAAATTRKTKAVARRLARIAKRAATALDRAASAGGTKAGRLYAKARNALAALVGIATTADGRGTLGVSLTALSAAVDALLAVVPSS